MRTLRNVAIVMALALAVAFVPAGGNLAEAILTAIAMGFLAGIAWFLFVFSRQNQLTLAALSDGRRALLYGALGMIALLIAGKTSSSRRGAARSPGSSCSPPRWRRSGASGSTRIRGTDSFDLARHA